MRILFDGKIFSDQHVGGINRYFVCLINHFPEGHDIVFTSDDHRNILYPEPSRCRLIFYNRYRLKPYALARRIEKYYFRWHISRFKPHIVHPSWYSLLTEQTWEQCPYPSVVTVHDMIHELFPSMFESDSLVPRLKKRAIEAANAIICVSENTRIDLLKFYPNAEPKVTVIPQATDIGEHMAHGPEQIPERPFFLFVGNRSQYKNFSILLEVLGKISHMLQDVVLCVVGGPLTPKERKRADELGISGRIEIYGNVTDAHLAKLYYHSIALVYPSLYEGFGIPPLEAMACGTVVVAANRSSIPEIVGEAAVLFDPDSVEDLAHCLQTVVSTPTLRDELIISGRARAALYSWDNTARMSLEVYKKAVR